MEMSAGDPSLVVGAHRCDFSVELFQWSDSVELKGRAEKESQREPCCKDVNDHQWYATMLCSKLYRIMCFSAHHIVRTPKNQNPLCVRQRTPSRSDCIPVMPDQTILIKARGA